MTFYLTKGGPVLGLILVVSVLAGALVIMQWLRLKRAERKHTKPLQELARLLQKRDWVEALRVVENHSHPFLSPWRTGLLLLIDGKHSVEDVQETISLEGNQFVGQLESLLKPLGAITAVLPMIGFLGTIIGLIISFQVWEELGAQISISVLAGGIYQAMITTAAGLLAAIPYYLLYHYLTARTQNTVFDFSKDTTQFVRWIKIGLNEPVSPQSVKVLNPLS